MATLSEMSLATIGSVVLDAHVFPRVGGGGISTKHEADIELVLGGAAVNCGLFGPVNGFKTAVISAQQGRLWASLCRELAAGSGLELLLAPRADGPAMSFIGPGLLPGERATYTQRLAPIEPGELTGEMLAALRCASLVVVGPMMPSRSSLALLSLVPGLAPDAYLALIPHRELLSDPAFPGIAHLFDLLQVNGPDSLLLPGASCDLRENAGLVAGLAGEDAACVVTNGPGRGWLIDRGVHSAIDPLPVQFVDETGCGDSLCATYAIGRALLALDVADALEYAIAAAACTARQIGGRRPLPYQGLAVRGSTLPCRAACSA